MDLLGGYGSDASSSSEYESATAPALVPPFAVKKPSVEPTTESKRRTRGKRLVSLHAVLPTHILDQLTKSTITGGGELDSDDDDDDNVPAPHQQDTKKHASVLGKDEGLTSFLSEQKSAPTTTILGGGGATKQKNNSAPLGQAFTTTQTVVVSREHADEVVDVHTSQPRPTSQLELERKVESVPARQAMKTSIPRPPSVPVSVPRPSGPVRPVVSTNSIALATAAPAAAPLMPEQTQQREVPYYQPLPEAKVDARLAKKRSRKEMEKALRSGNMQALKGSEVTTVQAEGSVYVPQEETYRVPSAGIRVAAVSMYDPKAGTDMVQANVTSKQRGKHQINQLLASAASLELQRARATGGSSGMGKRADAKRKYGW